MAKFEYKVTGKGVFAFDMLRYDTAWPAFEVETPKLAPHHPFDGVNKELRTITIRSDREPTNERWASFGWVVSELRKVK